ncbi:hypothetical protein DL771_010285 [Monosporascus sp. 5C6A]|nr:hypothetical protein DL771_010285 [Monosporascus sp. 5C6A]
MSPRAPLIVAMSVLAGRLVLASGPFKFCKDNTCGDCPVQVTDAGTGYPNCVVYSTDDVFGNQEGFPGSDGGGYAPFIDVPKPDPGCKIIIKSPADTTRAGCGYPVGSFSQGVCATVNLDTTFMVQFCCGVDDCKAAGASKRSAKFDSEYVLGSRSGGSGAAYLYRADGTKIEPIAEGQPPSTSEELEAASHTTRSTAEEPSNTRAKRGDPTGTDCPPSVRAKKRDLTEVQVFKRDCTPDEGSWEPAGDSYTRPSTQTSILLSEVGGGNDGTDMEITQARTQTWSTSASMDFGFADVLTLGVSFTQETGCQVTDEDSYTFRVPSGQTGDVGFTAFLECHEGTYSCGGERSDVVEICAPYRRSNDGAIDGIYALVAHS